MRNRRAQAVALAGLLTLAAPAFAEIPPAAAEHVSYAALDKLPDWRGIWTPAPGGPRSGAGEAPVFKGKYLDAYQDAQRRIRAGEHLKTERASNCTPPGMPGIMIQPYDIEFLFTPGRVTINQEAYMQIRRIFTDGRTPLDDPDPTYNGYSIGHWEGDTLVVRTIAIKPELGLFRFGATHSDKLVINERIHLKPGDPNVLQIDYTFEDADALAQPWHQSVAFERHRDLDQIEFVCAENDRNPVGPDGDTQFLDAGKQ
jgi:hypothetical protein